MNQETFYTGEVQFITSKQSNNENRGVTIVIPDEASKTVSTIQSRFEFIANINRLISYSNFKSPLKKDASGVINVTATLNENIKYIDSNYRLIREHALQSGTKGRAQLHMTIIEDRINVDILEIIVWETPSSIPE
jgi:hypothetical protein